MRTVTPKNRRRALRGAVAAASAAALLLPLAAGCSSASSPASGAAQKVTLTFWSWVPKIGQAVNLWNSTHPDIQVKLDEVPGGSNGTYTKMYAAVKAGNAPDIGQVEYAYLPNFVQLGDVVDVGSYVDQATKGDFAAGIWAEVSSGSSVYAVPQDIAPMGFYYRKDIFARDGITAPPATWAQFQQDAQIIHTKNPKQYITSFPTNQGDWFAGLAQQAGGTWFGQDGSNWKVTIGSDRATAKVASYWQGLIDSGVVKAEANWADAWDKDLQDGNVAGWITGAWGGPNLQSAAPSTSGDWAIAQMPQWTAGAKVTGDWGGSTNVVLKGSKYPQQAEQFIAWLNTDPKSLNILAAQSGLYLASSTWKSDASFATTSAFFGGQPLYSGLAEQSFPTGWMWGPTMSDTFNTFNDATGSLGQNSAATIAAALSSTQSDTVSTMKSQGFPVAN